MKSGKVSMINETGKKQYGQVLISTTSMGQAIIFSLAEKNLDNLLLGQKFETIL